MCAQGVVMHCTGSDSIKVTTQLKTSENSWEHRKTPKIIWYHPENNWGPIIYNLVQFEENFNSRTKKLRSGPVRGRHVDNFVADFWCFLLAPLKYQVLGLGKHLTVSRLLWWFYTLRFPYSTWEYADNGVIYNPLVLRPDSCQVYEEDGVKIRNT